MAARLNYNVGFEKFEKTVQLEAGSGAPAEVRQGFSEARDRFSQGGRSRSGHERGLEHDRLHQPAAG